MEDVEIKIGLTYYSPRNSWTEDMPAAHVPKYCVRVVSGAGKKWQTVVYGNAEDLPDTKQTRSAKQIEEDVSNHGKANEHSKEDWLKYLNSCLMQFGVAPR